MISRWTLRKSVTTKPKYFRDECYHSLSQQEQFLTIISMPLRSLDFWQPIID